jgi:WXG100 family type VII secretion target
MTGFSGMDIETVEQLAAQLKGKANEIDGLMGSIDALIEQLQAVWKGQDAIMFRDWWVSQHRPNLMHAREAIDGLGQSALNNASEQRQVSGR